MIIIHGGGVKIIDLFGLFQSCSWISGGSNIAMHRSFLVNVTFHRGKSRPSLLSRHHHHRGILDAGCSYPLCSDHWFRLGDLLWSWTLQLDPSRHFYTLLWVPLSRTGTSQSPEPVAVRMGLLVACRPTKSGVNHARMILAIFEQGRKRRRAWY